MQMTPSEIDGEENQSDAIVNLVPMRGNQGGKEKDDETNSLRNVHRRATGKARYIGVQVANIIAKAFADEPAMEKQILDSLGHEMEINETLLNSHFITKLRPQVLDLLVRNRAEGMEATCSINEIDEDGYKTCVRGHLLWAQVVGDPASRCARWLSQEPLRDWSVTRQTSKVSSHQWSKLMSRRRWRS